MNIWPLLLASHLNEVHSLDEGELPRRLLRIIQSRRERGGVLLLRRRCLPASAYPPAIASNSLAICAGATCTLHCWRKLANGPAILCKSAHCCGWVVKCARIAASPSPGGSAPALVTA